jgi:hypothetical protein
MATLGITDRNAVRRLEAHFGELLDELRSATAKSDFDNGYYRLVAAIRKESGRDFPLKAHPNYTNRLRSLARRLTGTVACIPG